ncbi:hypothetical protein [Aneurinibacillus aneurinilyticus]|uniref:Transcriptional regulator n=1 Tax=Aneurinibacillus aneurinilyticus TaxID=1391 RepID=A0A848D0G9_ANEAE|nr:hypothetical protein [Aneurinibacillus aneurinilyticus]NMF00250.1 hypothetical protein [Aneurinibacillus aneurinilyticus]
MILDTKRKVLIALYLEYQKDLPEMNKVTAASLELEPEVFKVAIDKLVHEGYLDNVLISRGGSGGKILSVRLEHAKLSRYAIHYIEDRLEIDPEATGEEKGKTVLKRFVDAGKESFENIVAKIVAELIKG